VKSCSASTMRCSAAAAGASRLEAASGRRWYRSEPPRQSPGSAPRVARFAAQHEQGAGRQVQRALLPVPPQLHHAGPAQGQAGDGACRGGGQGGGRRMAGGGWQVAAGVVWACIQGAPKGRASPCCLTRPALQGHTQFRRAARAPGASCAATCERRVGVDVRRQPHPGLVLVDCQLVQLQGQWRGRGGGLRRASAHAPAPNKLAAGGPRPRSSRAAAAH
jgi:hypothetical protein